MKRKGAMKQYNVVVSLLLLAILATIILAWIFSYLTSSGARPPVMSIVSDFVGGI